MTSQTLVACLFALIKVRQCSLENNVSGYIIRRPIVLHLNWYIVLESNLVQTRYLIYMVIHSKLQWLCEIE